MFKKIMVPVDLRHPDQSEWAIGVAADLAKHFLAETIYVAVAGPEPSELGHTPDEARARLDAFGTDQARRHGHQVGTHLIVSGDPAVDLDRKLLSAVDETGADLVIMWTHAPGVTDYVWASHGGALAQHAKVSVMLIRHR